MILGIFDGLHDAGAALVSDGKIVAAVNEERLVRRKLQGGYPAGSIEALFDIADISPDDISDVALGGACTPAAVTRLFRGLQKYGEKSCGVVLPGVTLFDYALDFLRYRVGIWDMSPQSCAGALSSRMAAASVGAKLPARIKPVIVEHHRAHAVGAWLTSGFKECLSITSDSVGDGIGAGVYTASSRGIRRLSSEPYNVSIATFWAVITACMGFVPDRDEGKVMALSASCDLGLQDVPFPWHVRNGSIQCQIRHGIPLYRLAKRLVNQYEPAMVAAWLQQGTERIMVQWIRHWCNVTGLKKLALSGGLFANVILTMKIAEEIDIDSIWVLPHMGDGGLAAGAALSLWLKQQTRNGNELEMLPQIKNAFYGPEAGSCDVDVDSALCHVEKPENLARKVAEILADGEPVAICRGRMEWGPRALGCRSILAPAVDRGMPACLNQALKRSGFMPFAPVAREENAESLFRRSPADGCFYFMTAATRATAEMKTDYPAAVHLDGTVRPQLVTRDRAPFFHDVLLEYERITGWKALINTSFNMHEEPIVCSGRDAWKSFLQSRLRHLIIDDRYICKKGD